MSRNIARVTIELPTSSEDLPAMFKVEFSPMPLYFAYQLDSYLPSAEWQRNQARKRSIFSFLEAMRRELEDAFDEAEKKLAEKQPPKQEQK